MNKEGSIISVDGPNGGGKSTALKLIQEANPNIFVLRGLGSLDPDQEQFTDPEAWRLLVEANLVGKDFINLLMLPESQRNEAFDVLDNVAHIQFGHAATLAQQGKTVVIDRGLPSWEATFQAIILGAEALGKPELKPWAEQRLASVRKQIRDIGVLQRVAALTTTYIHLTTSPDILSKRKQESIMLAMLDKVAFDTVMRAFPENQTITMDTGTTSLEDEQDILKQIL